jgi:hypothetical protein
MSGGGDICELVLQWVASGAMSAQLALLDFPQCAPFVDASGTWWFLP